MTFSPAGFLRDKIDFSLPHLLCVSGGKDSTFMLHALAQLAEEFRRPPEIIHFNHGLREDASEDEDFVRRMAEKFKFPLKVFEIEVKEFSSRRGLSLEEAARILRYRRLNEYTSPKDEKGVVFTAHNAGDQAETIILRIITGTGPSGMKGIRRRRVLESGWVLRRPLLDVSPSQIKEVLNEKKIPYRKDSTNLDTSIPRNFIRHRVLPLLKEINPSLEENIARSVEIFSEEDKFIRSLAGEALSEVNIKREKEKIVVELKTIISYNKTLLRRLIRRISPVELDFRRTEEACGIISAPGCSRRIDIGGGWKLRKDYGKLVFEKHTPAPAEFSYPLKVGEELYIPRLEVRIGSEIIDGKAPVSKSRKEEVFDAEKISPAEITVRSRRRGDKIKLPGSGHKKIKDILIDDKVPLRERNRVCIFEQGGRVLWAAPLRRTGYAPVDEQTKKTLILRVSYE